VLEQERKAHGLEEEQERWGEEQGLQHHGLGWGEEEEQRMWKVLKPERRSRRSTKLHLRTRGLLPEIIS
jgi:hypothetical protein